MEGISELDLVLGQRQSSGDCRLVLYMNIG